MTDEQNGPIMDGATEATAAEKREGLEEQLAVDHRGDTAGAEADRAVREHQTGLDAAEESGAGDIAEVDTDSDGAPISGHDPKR